jgi:regulator of replication initiation timing
MQSQSKLAATQKLSLSSTTRINSVNKSPQQPQRSSSANYPLNQPASSRSSVADSKDAMLEKTKQLKAENKKLVTLLKDSEKLFFQKIKETKQESDNLNEVFKQVWPLIKHKVKDPNGLLKTIGLADMQDANPTPVQVHQAEEVELLRLEIEKLKKGMAMLKQELDTEREQRLLAEVQFYQQQTQISEMRAFQQTVRAYTTQTKGHATLITAASTVVDSQEVPSFLKALYISGFEHTDEDANVGEAIDEDPRDCRSRSVLEKSNTGESSINPLKDFGVPFKQALRTRDISAGAISSRVPANS